MNVNADIVFGLMVLGFSIIFIIIRHHHKKGSELGNAKEWTGRP